MPNRQQQIELSQKRLTLVAERILKNLAYSEHHAHMGALQRIDLAYKMAGEIMAQPLDLDGPPDFPGMDPDGFFTDSEE
jgi:hypothetical protein